MKQYDNIRAHKPENIENKKFHIVGGGIAGLASAVFLIDDCYVKGENVTIYEKLPKVGGSMDGDKNEHGYLCRGERELEPYMECLWYLFNKIPSLDTPGRTVTEETVEANKEDPIFAHSRVLYEKGKVYEKIHDFSMSKKLQDKMINLIATPEEKFEDMTIDDYFEDTKEEFYKSSMWICFHSMLAFKNYHSVIEMKRYLIRFIQHLPGQEHLRGIIHTKYNEYDSMIKPMKKWLEDKGITIINDISIKDFEMSEDNNTVIGLIGVKDGEQKLIKLDENDNVILTNGSMTTNSSFGDNTHIAETNRDTQDKGVFTIWENLAKKDSKFGHPEKFDTNIDKTKWMSIFLTVKDYPRFFQRICDKYGYKMNTTTGAITILDSSWDISFVLYPKYYSEQKENENIMWFDTLYGEKDGDYIKKPSSECTGEEILTEFLYHLDMLDMKDELLEHTYISTCMMPYITSQFMPRKIEDRPHIIPDGCTNLALIGQFVELPGDVVFTVETSIRTAMMAAYGLTKVDRPVVPLYEAQYDLRILVMCMRKMLAKDNISFEDLPKINPLTIKKDLEGMLDFINSMPEIKDEDIIY